MAFDQTTRNRLARFVSDARALLAEEFTRQLQHEYGLDPASGEITAVEKLTALDDARRETALILRETMAYYLTPGPSPKRGGEQDVLERIVREQAFTVLNRLCALRMAEARGLILEAVAQGYRSKGFQLYARLAGSALGETGDAYRSYLFSLFDELALELPPLFDRFSPQGRLFPRESALLRLLDLLDAPDLEALWVEDETIGWIYQYFNSKEERQAMRAESSAPRNSRELAVRNQFFTPRYVVEFLTDNTLGRIWYEMTKGETGLKDACRYLVRRPREVFLGSAPVSYDDIPVWVRAVMEQGDFSALPEHPGLGEIGSLSLLIEGYSVAERYRYGDALEFGSRWMQGYVERGEPFPKDVLELWLILFAYQRGMLRQGVRDAEEAHDPYLQGIRAAYNALRQALQNPPDDLLQEELLRQPVFVPHRPLKDPRDILMLDPACGSMHFGLYAFDLYEKLYAEAWELEEHGGTGKFLRSLGLRPLHETYPDREAFLRDVPRLIIEHNIHGIDIDPRAVQIAGLSLWLRAQKSWQAQGLKPQERPQIRKSNIVCAEPMPGDQAMLDEFLAGLSTDHLEVLMRKALPTGKKLRTTQAMVDALAGLVRTVWQEMDLAGEAGSLLKIEETLREAIAAARKQADEKAPLFRVLEFGLNEPNKDQAGHPLAVEEQDFWNQAEVLVLAALREYAQQAENGGGYRRRLFAEDTTKGFAFIDITRTRYDLALMNPPFGEISYKAKAYIKKFYPDAYQDIAYAFTDRFSKLCIGGYVGAITTRTGFFLTTNLDWRKKTLGSLRRIEVLADLGYGVLDALVETAAYVLSPAKTYPLVIVCSLLQDRLKEDALQESIAFGGQRRYIADASRLATLPGAPFAYWAPQELIKAYEKCSPFEPIVGVVKRGVATGDNNRFLRLFWEVPPQNIGNNRDWVWYAKGGEYSPYFIPTQLLIRWQGNGLELRKFEDEKGKLRSRPQNIEYFYAPGLAYASRTTSGFGPRILLEDHGFDQTSNPIFLKEPKRRLSILALFMSRPILAFIELAVGGGDTSQAGTAARDYTNGLIGRVPIPFLNTEDEFQLNNIAAEIVSLLRTQCRFDETTPEFTKPLLSKLSDISLMSAIRRSIEEKLDVAIRILELSSLADVISIKAYSLGSESIQFLNEFVGFHPWNYTSEVENPLLSAFPMRQTTKKCYWADKNVETWSHEKKKHPSLIVHDEDFIDKQANSLINDETRKLISYTVGVSFGRWKTPMNYVGKYDQGDLIDAIAPLPNYQPALSFPQELVPVKSSTISDPNPLPTSIGILVSDDGHQHDITERVRKVLEESGAEETFEQELISVLETGSLRGYFEDNKGFFSDHLRFYSGHDRIAPIYWPLSTPSCSYTLWLYYHRLSDQTLFTCVNDFVDPKLKQVGDDLGRLRRKSGRSAADEKELERLTDLERELKDLRAELLRVAAFWKPDLNDGVEITAAPLWKLFQHKPWQKRLKETWGKLEAGEYDWAHLAYSIWPERVRKKCKTDKSLAIAHDLEHLYIEPKAPAKKRNKGQPVASEQEEMFDED